MAASLIISALVGVAKEGFTLWRERRKEAHKLKVEGEIRRYLQEKSTTQPLTERSSGCIFKNPDPERSGGKSAGALIEECGLKGLSVGGARVSEKHANFIVNDGKARTADVLLLIERLRSVVGEKRGVELELEVEVWGRPEGF